MNYRQALEVPKLLVLLSLAGCIFMDHKKVFEDSNNAAIGQVVDTTFYRTPHWEKELGFGRTEYGFKVAYNGCSWAFDIDSKTRVVLSWRYISDPKLCWKHYPTA